MTDSASPSPAASPDSIPCAIMRGGTSKGIYFLLRDLPADESRRNALILSLIGGDARQVNGLGGGDMLNAKVAVISPAAEKDADIDYRFIQVIPGENRIDTAPTCGNILSGAGAFAIEHGLVAAGDEVTTVTVRDINTGARVEQVIQTPGGKVRYAGDCEIAGAPGRGAPVLLYYLDFAGVKTGALFPAGAPDCAIDGIAMTCIDAAMPVVFLPAAAVGAAGDEPCAALQADTELKQRLETLRLQAAEKMGMGDMRGKVTPKIALVSAPKNGGSIASRYFTPGSAHAAYAVSGGIALAAAALTPGCIVHQFARPPQQQADGGYAVDIEHPSGVMRVLMHLKDGQPYKAGIIRTARLIMSGHARLEGVIT